MDPLAGKVTPFQRIWHRWRSLRNVPFRKKFFIGYDLNGNTYWEFFLENINANQRLRRIIHYRDNRKHFEKQEIPTQWMQWLRYTRTRHPTLTELLADVQRQQAMKILAKQADERWTNGSNMPLNNNNPSISDNLNQLTNQYQIKSSSTNNTDRLKNVRFAEKKKANDNPIESAFIKPRR
ncbi:uncharacterized protein ASCRUDRAFT_90209 [Ascoidea rubescens DSM 1968]|uniref:Uncharacterized protein n=1 Tax=Ascoidea rubescens DSM 1968 TaxID=1344418 RepID=A0A1D2VKX8_9ASCO|nr:hypothetical protein ASCRUDRAFT_90209 [Ascoidea rubescens DSM 1968]ODV62245.1 hypothetical protein ASCRUDRAFT_90209 [Ascoidea rubescens DSM 1968]